MQKTQHVSEFHSSEPAQAIPPSPDVHGLFPVLSVSQILLPDHGAGSHQGENLRSRVMEWNAKYKKDT